MSGGDIGTRRGFTLLEVMLALALLGFGLVVLMKSSANSIVTSEASHMLGIATDLARGKMYDIEEQLMKDGFTDTDQSQLEPKPFDQEGWPNIFYTYKVEIMDMPPWDELTALAQGHQKMQGSAYGSGYGSGSAWARQVGSAAALYGSDYAGLGSDAVTTFQNSTLGGLITGFAGAGLGSASELAGAAGGAFIQVYYSMFQQILKVSVRKVSVTVTYKVLGSDRDLKLVAFFTDPKAMDIVLNGLGSVDLGDGTGSGSGSGSGTGSGSAVKTPTTGTPSK